MLNFNLCAKSKGRVRWELTASRNILKTKNLYPGGQGDIEKSLTSKTFSEFRDNLITCEK